MARLSNIFINIDLNFSEKDRGYGEKYLKEVIQKQANILYRQDVRVEVHLVDGSVKIYVAILGSIYIAIGQYGSFRSGIDYLKKDAKILVETTVNDLQKNGLSKESIIKVTSNAGVVDKVKRLIIRLERVKSNIVQNEKTKIEINNIIQYTNKILDDLSDEDDVKLIMSELHRLDVNNLVYRKTQLDIPVPRPVHSNIFIRNNEEYDKYLYKVSNNENLLEKKHS